MKNVTITLEEEVARWARIWAAENNTSVSRFLGQLLEQRMIEERGYQDAIRQYLDRTAKPLKRSGTYPARHELHDR